MTSILRQSPVLQLLWKRKLKFCRTALKWRVRYKVKMATFEKSYYKIHRSKSNRRKFVTGGPKLKDSGIYTQKFCLAVVKMWDTACAAKMNGFANSTSTQVHYTKLWKDMLAASQVEKDPNSLLQQVFFPNALALRGYFQRVPEKNPNNDPARMMAKFPLRWPTHWVICKWHLVCWMTDRCKFCAVKKIACM